MAIYDTDQTFQKKSAKKKMKFLSLSPHPSFVLVFFFFFFFWGFLDAQVR